MFTFAIFLKYQKVKVLDLSRPFCLYMGVKNNAGEGARRAREKRAGDVVPKFFFCLFFYNVFKVRWAISICAMTGSVRIIPAIAGSECKAGAP